MQLRGKIGALDARILLDSGAEGGQYISRRFCELFGIAINPQPATHHRSADGSKITSYGTVTMKLQLHSYRQKITFQVIDLVNQFDILLG